MSTKPKVTVIMAAHNAGDYLSQSVNSILSQTYRSFELIIVDDGSTDSSVSAIEIQKLDKRIKIIRNASATGPASARNKALDIAEGKYIAILDADDISTKNRLEVQSNYLDQRKDIHLVASRAIKIDSSGKVIGLSRYYGPFTTTILKKRNAITHSSVMFRNTKMYRYREKFRFAHDYDLYLQILSDGKKIKVLRQALVSYRFNPKAISFTKRYQQTLYAQEARRMYFERIVSGKDSYSTFNSDKVMAAKSPTSKESLRAKVETEYQLNNLKSCKENILKYKKKYGIDHWLLTYTIAYLIKKVI